MKKILSLLLSFALLISLVACSANKPVETNTTEADNGLGKELVLYSTMTETDLNALLEGFNQKYPDIKVDVVSGTIGETTARIRAELGNPQGDVTWGGLADSDGEQYADLFEKWVCPSSANAIEGYSTPNGIYSMDHLSTVVFSINTELEKELGLKIESYEDLLDPKLKGKVMIANPNSSSSAWNNLCNIMAVYGTDSKEAWDFIEKLMPNLVIVDSSSACFKSVESGEYVVGLTYEDGAIKLVEDGAGDHFTIRYPKNGASASAFGMAVIKGCKHPEAAKAMIEYVCSAEGSSFIAQKLKTLRMTNKDTVYGGSLLPAASDIKWVKRDVPYLTEHKKAILEHWNELLDKVKK